MSLSDKDWRRVRIHRVVSEFLLAEFHRVRGFLPQDLWTLVTSPNLGDSRQNHIRLSALCYCRAELIGEVPPDTIWYEVSDLTAEELPELRVIARCGLWTDEAGRNELPYVAQRIQRKDVDFATDPRSWSAPILWGHDRTGPFTILDGNHRLLAYLRSVNPPPISVRAMVGLSPTPCFWHIHDVCGKLCNDLWSKARPPFDTVL